LLDTLPTVTTTFPVVAPDGTATTMPVADQLVGVAGVPLNVTVPGVDPKFAPVIVTTVLTGPLMGERPVILGDGLVTLNNRPLLATLPTVTTTFPVVAPDGTDTTMLVADQLVGVADVPLNVTVPLVDPKFAPVIVTAMPTGPLTGDRLVILGAGLVTVNNWPLLDTLPTVTTAFPVVAPDGTGTTMLAADQLVGVAGVPLNATAPFVDPKFAPVIVTTVPTGPLTGDRLVILGAGLLVLVLDVDAPRKATICMTQLPPSCVAVAL